jgi:hypothetical protein
LGFKNGYSIKDSTLHGIGGEAHESERFNHDTEESVTGAVDNDPYLIYGRSRAGDYRTQQKYEPKFRPAHVVLNKIVSLTFLMLPLFLFHFF